MRSRSKRRDPAPRNGLTPFSREPIAPRRHARTRWPSEGAMFHPCRATFCSLASPSEVLLFSDGKA